MAGAHRGCDPSPPAAGAAPRPQLDRAVGDADAEGRADRALDQLDLAAMGAHQLGRDGEAEPGAAGPGRALERLEQVAARLVGDAGPGIRYFDHRHRALAPPVDADLVARRIVRRDRKSVV